VYRDLDNIEHGPFGYEQMAAWCQAKYFTAELMVAKKLDATKPPETVESASSSTPAENFQPISELPEFASFFKPDVAMQVYPQDPSQMMMTTGVSQFPMAYQMPNFLMSNSEALANALRFQSYSQVAQFNTRTGRFQATASEQTAGAKALPTDRAERQIAHFMDLEAYQEQRRAAKQLQELGVVKPKKGKKPKVPKKKKIPAWLSEIQ